jgi:[acyl-carrier-protein] S-malonyltransferase
VGLGGGALVGLLFPGQGSQFVGMGKELASSYPAARAVFEEADQALGTRLSKLAWEGPEAELTLTLNAQPAILVHSIAVHRAVADRIGKVDLAAGHSLGEFSAYVAAGSMSLADAVRTVRRRGELMYHTGQERPGTMAALIGLADDKVEQLCIEASASGGQCVAANFNAPSQVVISGDVPTVQKAMELSKAFGAKRAIQLNVSGAFHSPLMMTAAPGLAAQLDTVELRQPAFSVVSNVTAKPVRDVVDVRRLLIEQLTSPVRWTASMQTMVQAGVTSFYEIGPGDVLCGLLKRIERSAACRNLGTPSDIDALAK